MDQAHGAEVVSVSRAADTLADHVDRIRQAAATADVVMTTGGTAAGPVDHLHTAVAQLGARFDRQCGGSAGAPDGAGPNGRRLAVGAAG